MNIGHFWVSCQISLEVNQAYHWVPRHCGHSGKGPSNGPRNNTSAFLRCIPWYPGFPIQNGTFSILFPTSSSMNRTPQQGSLELLAAEYVEQSPQIVTTAAGSLQFAPIRIPACSSEYTARFNPQNTFSRLILEITHVSNKKATIFSLQTGGQPHSCYTGKCQRGIFQLERGNTKGR